MRTPASRADRLLIALAIAVVVVTAVLAVVVVRGRSAGVRDEHRLFGLAELRPQLSALGADRGLIVQGLSQQGERALLGVLRHAAGDAMPHLGGSLQQPGVSTGLVNDEGDVGLADRVAGSELARQGDRVVAAQEADPVLARVE